MRAITLAVLLGLTAWFLSEPKASLPPIVATQHVDAEQIQRGAIRSAMPAPPSTLIEGIRLRCSECHALFESQHQTDPDLRQHKNLGLDHGMNERCFNCHSYEDRNMLILDDDVEIGFDEVERLCAKCHGPTYRDWQAGMHGKTLGSWRSDSPEFRRLACNECHDPHAPAFDPIATLPGPNTLRMGERSTHSAPPRRRNPLRIWSQGDAADPHAAEAGPEQAAEHAAEDATEPSPDHTAPEPDEPEPEPLDPNDEHGERP